MGRVVSLATGALTMISTQGKCGNDIYRNAEQTQSCIAKKKILNKTESKMLARGNNGLECKHTATEENKRKGKRSIKNVVFNCVAMS